jgi:hypothetical protein
MLVGLHGQVDGSGLRGMNIRMRGNDYEQCDYPEIEGKDLANVFLNHILRLCPLIHLFDWAD